jgi:hypothetical protein
MSPVVELFVQQLIGSLPLLVVYLGGLILALVFWSRQPRASLLLLLGLGVLLVNSTAGSCLWSWLVVREMEGGPRGPLLTILGFARSLLYGTGMALVIAAVFVGRSRPQHVAPPPHEGHGPAPTALPAGEPADRSPHVTRERPRNP